MAFQGKPIFNLTYEELKAVLVEKSVRGIMGIILFDDTQTFEKKEYYAATDVMKEEWNEENYKILKALAFRGNPFKVVCYRTTEEELNETLKMIALDEVNYLCCPYDKTESQTLFSDLESWINSKRNQETIKLGNTTSTIKLVTSSKASPDQPWIIDYDERQTQHVVTDFEDTTFNAQEYTVCIASLCAGAPLNMSITNKKTPWLKAFTTKIEDENQAIKDGKLITGFDGKRYKIVRGVTSFTTANDKMNKTFSKIRMMEIMDINQKDIRIMFTESYEGKYQNILPSRNIFFTAINAYLKDFMNDGQLNPAYENKMKHDLEAIRNHIRAEGVYLGNPISEEEILKLTEYQLLRADTGDTVYGFIPQYRPTDVMENFEGKAIIA